MASLSPISSVLPSAIFRTASAYQRAIDVAGSENFGLCFCVGTWAEGGKGLEKDVYEKTRKANEEKQKGIIEGSGTSKPSKPKPTGETKPQPEKPPEPPKP